MKTQIKKPEASIIIVNFNNAKYLGDCINSILKQSYKNKEIIVVDDMRNLALSEKVNFRPRAKL